MQRRYGRNIPAPLPVHRMLTRVSPTLPDVVDLRWFCGPVKDQQNEGSCTGHAGSSAMEWVFRRYLKKSPVLSPQYFYVQELIRDGSFPNDSGSDGVSLCETAIFKGCCEASVFPYVAGQIQKPTPEQDANASNFRLGAYHGLAGSRVLLSVLGDPVPWPVAVGFTVYDSFESPETAATGVMSIPATSESILGGHEVLAVGYDVGETPTLRPANCPKAVRMQNSWGKGWGLTGYFWMPLEIIDRADTDLKICHSGRPWV